MGNVPGAGPGTDTAHLHTRATRPAGGVTASHASGVTFEENKEKDNNDSIRSGV